MKKFKSSIFIAILSLVQIAFAQNNEVKDQNLGYIIDKITSNEDIKYTIESLKEEKINLTVTNLKRNSYNEIIAIKLSLQDANGNKSETEQTREIPIRPIFIRTVATSDGINKVGFYDNSKMIQQPKDEVNEKKIALIESMGRDAIIFVDKERYSKEALELLDTHGLETIEVVKDKNTIKSYDVKNADVIYVITTNWNKNNPATAIKGSKGMVKHYLDSEREEIALDANDPDKAWYSLTDAFAGRKIKINIANIKRDANNKIIAIDIIMKAADGRVEKLNINRTNPVKAISLFVDKTKNPDWDFGIKELDKELDYSHK